jgi:hypothetical protein
VFTLENQTERQLEKTLASHCTGVASLHTVVSVFRAIGLLATGVSKEVPLEKGAPEACSSSAKKSDSNNNGSIKNSNSCRVVRPEVRELAAKGDFKTIMERWGDEQVQVTLHMGLRVTTYTWA